VDDADAPADHTAYDALSWTTGAASIAWDPIPAFTLNLEYDTPADTKDVIQAIVNRAGWATGQDMLYRVSDYEELSSVSALRYIFDSTGNSAKDAKLHVEYTTGEPAGQPTMHRTQGIPTGAGYRDRPGRWN